MLNISRINNSNYIYNKNMQVKTTPAKTFDACSVPMKQVSSTNLMAYHPSFTSNTTVSSMPSQKKQLSVQED